MSDKERQTILERTSFKNVSGNWQFRGDMTPERFLRIAEDVTSERPKAWNEAIDAAIEMMKENPIGLDAIDEEVFRKIGSFKTQTAMSDNTLNPMESKNIERYKVNVLHDGKERFKYARTIKRARFLQQVATDGGLSSIIWHRKEDGKYHPI